MKFPDLHRITAQSLQTAKRFPASIIAAFMGFCLCIFLFHKVGWSGKNEEDKLLMLLLLSNVAMVFSVSTSLWAERSQFKTWRIQIQFVSLLFVYALYFTISFPIVEVDFYQVGMYMLAAHFLIAFLPFLGKSSTTSFWQYNRILFQRIIQSVLFSGTLFIGISVALLSIDKLLHVDMPDKIYGDLLAFIACIFNTWYFLAGISHDWEVLEQDTNYPSLLKQFVQFVLLPLVVVYLGILYLYLAEIIITFLLPSGWVGWLVLCFSIAGILALLLIWPIQNKPENSWILVFSKYFYLALFPLIILLFLAAYERIYQYGVTPNRYYLVELAIWLTVVTLYFTFSREKNIERIPQSLFVAALISLIGPVGAVGWSVRSQKDRFQKILTQNNALSQGRFIPDKNRVWKDNDGEQLRSMLDFFRRTNSFAEIQPFLAISIDSLLLATDSKRGLYQIVNSLEIYLRVGYSNQENQEKIFYCNFLDKNPKWRSISGYDYWISTNFGRYQSNTVEITGLGSFIPDFQQAKIKFVSLTGEEEIIDFKPVVNTCYNLKQQYSDTYTVSVDSTKVLLDTPSLTLIALTNSIEAFWDKDSVSIDSWYGDILVKKRITAAKPPPKIENIK